MTCSFRIIKIGKPAFSEYEKLVSTYSDRIKHSIDASFQIIKDTDQRQTAAKVKELVVGGSRSRNKSLPILISLDESGELLSSINLSTKLQSHIESGREVIFLIGGPYGIDPEILKLSQWRWCLSRSTLTSDMAWLIATEQIYRALTILKGQPYHHV